MKKADDDFEDLQRLLRLKRYERPPEHYFDQFLAEFQRRQRAELLHRSAHGIFFERIGTYFSDLRRQKWVYAAGAAYAVFMIGLFAWPTDQSAGGPVTASAASPSGRSGLDVADSVIWAGEVSITPVHTSTPNEYTNLVPSAYGGGVIDIDRLAPIQRARHEPRLELFFPEIDDLAVPREF